MRIGRSRVMAWAAVASWTVAAVCSFADPNPDHEALIEYWRASGRPIPSNVTTADDLAHAVERVNDSLSSRLSGHRLYALPTGDGFVEPFTVVAVGKGGEVLEMATPRAFNKLLNLESVRAEGCDGVRLIAEAFFRYRYYGWQGHSVFPLIQTSDEISVDPADHKMRDDLATRYSIVKPHIVPGESQCTYVVYGWSPVFGWLARVEVELEKETGRVSNFRVIRLADHVGLYNQY